MIMQKPLLHTVLVCFFAFLGGFVSNQLFSPSSSSAEDALSIARSGMVSTVQVFRDSAGRKRIDIDTSRDYPVQDFYGENGTLRLQLGTYSGPEKAGSEGGLPLIGLSDTMGRLRMLFRLAQGKNQSPVIVFKDTKGKDRIILGTAFNDGDEDPFLAYFDKHGGKHTVFGKF
jgi:hypothetical protein